MRRVFAFAFAALFLLLSVRCDAVVANAEGVKCGFATQRVQCNDLGCDRERGICILCRSTSDCYPGGMVCDVDSGKCVVPPFRYSFGLRVTIAMIFAFLVCSVGVIAGVGGGGILVPMFAAIMRFPMEPAVGLSQSTICGQTSLNVYLTVQQKYPDSTWDRPLINYQYLSLMLPLGLIGTLIGGILSKICPDAVRLTLLFVLLSAVLVRSVKKTRKQYEADKEAHLATIDSPNDPHHQHASYGSTAHTSESSASTEKVKLSNTDATPSARPSQTQYPILDLTLNFSLFIMLVAFNVARTRCTCGGALYWTCVLMPLAVLTGAFCFSRERVRVLAQSSPEKLTFAWNYRNTVLYPMVAVIAGAGAAMLGIGGGLVLGFVLYEIGLVPEEASVTGGMATFFMAFSSALQLLMTGHLMLDYSAVLFVVGLGSTALGEFVFMKYIKEHGLRYLIVGSLALIVGGSLVVLGGYGIYESAVLSRNGGSVLAVGKLCMK